MKPFRFSPKSMSYPILGAADATGVSYAFALSVVPLLRLTLTGKSTPKAMTAALKAGAERYSPERVRVLIDHLTTSYMEKRWR